MVGCSFVIVVVGGGGVPHCLSAGHCPPPLLTLAHPPCEQGLTAVVVVVPPISLLCPVSSFSPIIVGPLLSTCGPPCKQGLATVVVGASQLHCPGVVITVIVVVF